MFVLKSQKWRFPKPEVGIGLIEYTNQNVNVELVISNPSHFVPQGSPRPLSQLGLGPTPPGQLGLFIFLMVNRDITYVLK